mgnify:CR=1 FL=1
MDKIKLASELVKLAKELSAGSDDIKLQNINMGLNEPYLLGDSDFDDDYKLVKKTTTRLNVISYGGSSYPGMYECVGRFEDEDKAKIASSILNDLRGPAKQFDAAVGAVMKKHGFTLKK